MPDRTRIQRLLGRACVALALAAVVRIGDASAQSRQTLDDAWWTGPMLANSPGTLPRGHFLVEPYLYDVKTRGRYDRDGVRHAAPASNGFGSLTYIIYGLADRVSLGFVPTAGYTTTRDGRGSSGIGIGDASMLVQYGLTRFHVGSWVPATAVAIQETFPTGKYDHLGDRPFDGFGSGAYTTTLSFYSQSYFWLPNGRILRVRFDVSHALSSNVDLEDVSVYGTDAGFRGRATPGSASYADLASEYSITKRWVFALDVTYRHDRNTGVAGYDVRDAGGASTPPSIRLASGPSDAFGLAPAIEYSWRPDIGVLLGARIIAAGRNTAATITPALAVNIVR